MSPKPRNTLDPSNGQLKPTAKRPSQISIKTHPLYRTPKATHTPHPSTAVPKPRARQLCPIPDTTAVANASSKPLLFTLHSTNLVVTPLVRPEPARLGIMVGNWAFFSRGARRQKRNGSWVLKVQSWVFVRGQLLRSGRLKSAIFLICIRASCTCAWYVRRAHAFRQVLPAETDGRSANRDVLFRLRWYLTRAG